MARQRSVQKLPGAAQPRTMQQVAAKQMHNARVEVQSWPPTILSAASAGQRDDEITASENVVNLSWLRAVVNTRSARIAAAVRATNNPKLADD